MRLFYLGLAMSGAVHVLAVVLVAWEVDEYEEPETPLEIVEVEMISAEEFDALARSAEPEVEAEPDPEPALASLQPQPEPEPEPEPEPTVIEEQPEPEPEPEVTEPEEEPLPAAPYQVAPAAPSQLAEATNRDGAADLSVAFPLARPRVADVAALAEPQAKEEASPEIDLRTDPAPQPTPFQPRIAEAPAQPEARVTDRTATVERSTARPEIASADQLRQREQRDTAVEDEATATDRQAPSIAVQQQPAAEQPPPRRALGDQEPLQTALAPRRRPRPEPPRQVAQADPEPRPQPEPQRQQPNFFDRISTAIDETRGTQPQPNPQPSRTERTAPRATGPLGPPLTGAEKDGIRLALKRCWSRPDVGGTDPNLLLVVMDFDLSPDGWLTGEPVAITPRGAISTRQEAAIRQARAALVQCSPFALPPEKYDQWKELRVRFDPVSQDVGVQ